MNIPFASIIAAALLSVSCAHAQAATYVEETGLAITIEVADNGNATVIEEMAFQTMAMNPWLDLDHLTLTWSQRPGFQLPLRDTPARCESLEQTRDQKLKVAFSDH